MVVKGLEKIIIGMKKVVAGGVIGSILIACSPAKALAETVYSKIHEVGFSLSGKKYKKGMPTTELGVKVDLDRKDDKYELALMFFTEDWNKRKSNLLDYVTITNLGTNLTMALPNEMEIGKIRQYVRCPKRASLNDQFASAGWVEIRADKEYPAQKLKLRVMEEGGKAALSLVPAVLAGGFIGVAVYAGINVLAAFGKDITEYNIAKAKLEREETLESFAENYYAESIPVNPADQEITARKLKIPLKETEKLGKGEALLYLNVGLVQGTWNSERRGLLENLLVKVPLVNYKGKIEKLDDNVCDFYDAMIVDEENNKTTLNKIALGYKNSSPHDTLIRIRKKGAHFNIPFSKLKSIEFLGRANEGFYNRIYAVKISLLDGTAGEFEYAPSEGEHWGGKVNCGGLEGDFNIYPGKIKKIIFLRKDGKNKAWILFNDINIYSKPNLESKCLGHLEAGTKIDVLEHRIESPTNEDGARGGIQIYDRIYAPELDMSGYIPRAGDDIAPFSKTGKFEDAPGNRDAE